jgi:hypothetical protein
MNVLSTTLPKDQTAIHIAGDISEIFAGILAPDNMASVFRRNLAGDFNGLAAHLKTTVDVSDLSRLEEAAKLPDPNIALAAEHVLSDIRGFKSVRRAWGDLRVEWPDNRGLPTYFHTDNDKQLLCPYTKPVTEFVFEEDARVVDNLENIMCELRDNRPFYSFNPTDIWIQAHTNHPKYFGHRKSLSQHALPRLLLVMKYL